MKLLSSSSTIACAHICPANNSSPLSSAGPPSACGTSRTVRGHSCFWTAPARPPFQLPTTSGICCALSASARRLPHPSLHPLGGALGCPGYLRGRRHMGRRPPCRPWTGRSQVGVSTVVCFSDESAFCQQRPNFPLSYCFILWAISADLQRGSVWDDVISTVFEKLQVGFCDVGHEVETAQHMPIKRQGFKDYSLLCVWLLDVSRILVGCLIVTRMPEEGQRGSPWTGH